MADEVKRSKETVHDELLAAIVNHLGNHPDLVPLLKELQAEKPDEKSS